VCSPLLQHGYTPLYVAVMESKVRVVEELLKHGANRRLSPDVSCAAGGRFTPHSIVYILMIIMLLSIFLLHGYFKRRCFVCVRQLLERFSSMRPIDVILYTKFHPNYIRPYVGPW